MFGPAKSIWKTEIDKYFKTNGLIDITNSDFPALMKEVYDNAFKSSHAVSGFEACGLFPLNRDKITKEKLNIGRVFREAENEFEPEESSESDLSIDLDPFLTPQRLKPSGDSVKSLMKSVKQIVETSNKNAANSITSSVISYLHENHLAAAAKKQKRKQRSAATSSYILTEDSSRAELAAKDAEKLRLVEDKLTRKKTRDRNKKLKLVAKELATQN